MDSANESPSKPQKASNPSGEHRAIKQRDRAVSDMKYLEYIRNYGAPPAPLFKAQAAPTDIFGEMELPPGELSEKDPKDEGELRKMLSSPPGILHLVQEEDEADLDEENDKVDASTKQSETRNTSNAINVPMDLKNVKFGPFAASTRYRSRSENITSGSIFKFMENTLDARKGQTNVNSLF